MQKFFFLSIIILYDIFVTKMSQGHYGRALPISYSSVPSPGLCRERWRGRPCPTRRFSIVSLWIVIIFSIILPYQRPSPNRLVCYAWLPWGRPCPTSWFSTVSLWIVITFSIILPYQTPSPNRLIYYAWLPSPGWCLARRWWLRGRPCPARRTLPPAQPMVKK